MNLTYGFSRREFLAHTSCFGAFYALASRIPLPNLAAKLAGDSRVSQTPLVDKGFASVRKIGNGLYATVSDPSKGPTTICNRGFLNSTVLGLPNYPLDPAKMPMSVDLGGLKACSSRIPAIPARTWSRKFRIRMSFTPETFCSAAGIRFASTERPPSQPGAKR